MRYRRLGRTDLRVSEIGFGAWGIGKQLWRGGDDEQSLRALHEAVEQGINFIDTALVYGRGHSERLIGRLLRERSEPLLVATKIPPLNLRWPAQGSLDQAYPPEHIVRSVEESLTNLGSERIDLLQLHVWHPSWLERNEWDETLGSLRDQGKIAFWGVSLNDHQPDSALELVASGRAQVIQVIYNLFEQAPEDRLLGACADAGVGVIARVPLDEGGLTGNITPESSFPRRDFRSFYFRGDRKQQVFERVEAIRPHLGPEAESLAELALKFCLHHPAVSTVLAGMRRAEHVRANAAVGEKPPLSAALVQQLRAHRWEKNFYL